MAEPHLVAIYEFKVVLRGASPMIWRRILLRCDQTIADLHYAIQIAMGWSDSHLHRFRIHGKDYGVCHEGGIGFNDNADRVYLADFQFRLRERFLYEYDSTTCGSMMSAWREFFLGTAGCVRFAPAGDGSHHSRTAAGREPIWNKEICAGRSDPMLACARSGR